MKDTVLELYFVEMKENDINYISTRRQSDTNAPS